MNPVLPKWDADQETADDAHMMSRYKVYPCSDYRDGNCCARSCFDYHSDAEMRRPVVDSNGQLLYWDAVCPFTEKAQPCPYGYGCQFAHTVEERNYHPGQFEQEARPHCTQFSLRQNMRDALPAPDDQNHGPNSVYKRRFCAHYPKVDNCRRKEFCMFAHSREEIRAPLLTEEEEGKEDLSNAFFIHKFKIFWCPIGVQHDWQTCAYAHNYQDARRNPAIGYGPRPCPFWEKKDRAPSYEARCPNGFKCPYSHGAKEQLYHPRYFKTVVCWDFDQNCHGCPRDTLCAFYHRKKTQRQAGKDSTNYMKPLGVQTMRKLQPYFRNPPFFADEPEMGRGQGRRGKRDSAQQVPRPLPMMMMMDPCGAPMMPCGYPGEMSPCGSPMSNTSRNSIGQCTPMMMAMDGSQQMPMMMYLPQSPMSQGPYMMQDPYSPYGSPMMNGSLPLSNGNEKDDGTPKKAQEHTGNTPFGSPTNQGTMDLGVPFGGLFTMPVDKNDCMQQPGMPGAMMMVPMFVDPTQGFEPQHFGDAFNSNSNVEKKGFLGMNSNMELQRASTATNSGGTPTDPSDASDAESASASQPFQSQYLWTEAATA